MNGWHAESLAVSWTARHLCLKRKSRNDRGLGSCSPVLHACLIVHLVSCSLNGISAESLRLEQARDSLEVLEEAIQAAALEADFTFPDDVSSSNGDQSLVIDDIIESLESDALEAEQEALAVQQAEAAAQVCTANFIRLFSSFFLSTL